MRRSLKEQHVGKREERTFKACLNLFIPPYLPSGQHGPPKSTFVEGMEEGVRGRGGRVGRGKEEGNCTTLPANEKTVKFVTKNVNVVCKKVMNCKGCD